MPQPPHKRPGSAPAAQRAKAQKRTGAARTPVLPYVQFLLCHACRCTFPGLICMSSPRSVSSGSNSALYSFLPSSCMIMQ